MERERASTKDDLAAIQNTDEFVPWSFVMIHFAKFYHFHLQNLANL